MDDKDNDDNMRWASVVVYGFLILMALASLAGFIAYLYAEEAANKPVAKSVKK